MNRQGIENLPRRPQGGNSEFKQVELSTNYKAVSMKYPIVYLYSISFEERNMGPDNRLQYNRLLMNSESILSKEIGANYSFSGRTLYGFAKPSFTQKIVSLELDGSTLNAKIRLVKEIKLADVMNGDNRQPIMFLNSKLKNVLRKLGFNQIGKSRKYFNTKKCEDLGDLLLYRGYETCFVPKISGLLIKIETANRIVRKESVLNFIMNIYESNKSLSKEQKREVVRETLLHRSVMANYGTSVSWKIQDIVFDKPMDNVMLDGQDSFDLVEYYKNKHNIIIQNQRQPLIKSSDKLKKTVYLIPELCLMTGIPQNCDQRRRMEISKMTIKDSDYKSKKIYELDDMLSNGNNPEQGWRNLSQIGINVDRDFFRIQAQEVQCSQLMMGQNPVGSNKFDCVDRGKEACFQLFNKALFKNKVQLNMIIIHFGFNTQDVKRVFTSTSQKILLPIRIVEKDLGRFDNNWFDILQGCIENKKDSVNMIFMILPVKAKVKYPDVKKLCYSDQDTCVASQIALEAKLSNQKSAQSVATKLLLQMAVKIGNILWVPKPPKTDLKILIIGIAMAKIPHSKTTVVAYNSTKDRLYSRYHSNYRYQSQAQSSTIIQKAGEIVLDCIKAYVDYNNNQYPNVVIILREGSTDAQTQIIMENEVKHCLSAIQLSKKNIDLVYISLDKKPTTKFFKRMDNRTVNPNAGTLVRNEVISTEGDFYLISNQNRMSAVVPVYYKILFNNTKNQGYVDSSLLSKLFYSQSHNYMNWTGSVRVPAQLQYACKLAKFKSQFFKDKQVHHKLQSVIYYI